MKYAVIEWRDGQPYSPAFDDIYFSSEGGRDESSYVFLQQNGLPQRWRGVQQFVVAETGFGTGLNFVLTLKAWLENAEAGACLHYTGIEKHPVSPDDIRRLSTFWPELKAYFDALLSVYPLPVAGHHARELFDGRVRLQLVFMDVLEALRDSRLAVDAWYLDGFGPAKNPAIWSAEVFRLIAQNSHQATSLSTFSCAGDVRRGLIAAGFDVSRVPGFGRKREMITAELGEAEQARSATPWFELPASVVNDKTAIIIGAGIAGLTTAWSLVQRGFRVTLLDKHPQVAQAASGNPAGLVLPRMAADNDVDMSFYSSAFLFAVHQLARLQPYAAEPFWFDTGVFSLDQKHNTANIIERYAYPQQYLHRPPAETVPACLAHQADRLAYFPRAGWVKPAALCRALVTACGEALSLRVLEVARLERSRDGWKLMTADGTAALSARVVVIANGVGVNAFEQTSWLPVSAIRGQLSFVAASEQSAALQQALSFDAYVTPAFEGQHCVGATYSYVNQSTALLQQDQDRNLDQLDSVLPGMFVRPTGLAGRVGFRAVSSDRVPLVGAVPDIEAFQRQYAELHHGRKQAQYENGQYLEGLYVSAAHGSRGLCSSFISGEIVASLIENAPVPVGRAVLNHLNPARFIIRHLRRSPKKAG